MAPPPTTVAVVDIIKLIDKLNQKSDWEVQLSALKKRISDEHVARKKVIEDLTKQAEAAPEPERTALRDKLTFQTLELNRWASMKMAEIDRESAFMWMDLYRSIRVEASKLATADGYDLVLVNDGVTELQLQQGTRVPQEQQAQEQIMRRRVLFASGTIDITDKLILRMNNARSTAGGSAPAGTPPADATTPPSTSSAAPTTPASR